MLDEGHVVAAARRQHAELVAAEPGDQALRPDRLHQARPEVAQHHVAVVVPERVVDLLETVEVHQHHREARPA